jgi:molybdopterin-containing oxidoreductase family membrane subunit
MGAECRVMGLFTDENKAAMAITALSTTPWHVEQVHSPIPSHKLSDALQQKKSKVGYFTLIGGIIGFFSGFALAMFTATRWSLIVGGKPVVALVPFVIVGFEFTILFAIFGNVIGLLTQGNLPDYQGLDVYDSRCSGDHFGVLAICPETEKEQLITYFKEKGGITRVFRNPENGKLDDPTQEVLI